ncbi:MAG: hypothetical protein K8J31_18690 [Anaerolineae bacterium]|nr:hypothetical protein [Anaerolineae bacterium]
MTANILRQRKWTDEELKAEGFQYYQPVKRLVMARLLFQSKNIDLSTETITGKVGDFICYNPGSDYHENPDEYDHWPVRRDIFFKSYRPWDEASWKPNVPEKHLLSLGCQPYYKYLGVWAQRLRETRAVQSLESPEPVDIPAGYWLIIGSEGEPYSTPDDEFRKRYEVSAESVRDRIYWAAVTGRSHFRPDDKT